MTNFESEPITAELCRRVYKLLRNPPRNWASSQHWSVDEDDSGFQVDFGVHQIRVEGDAVQYLEYNRKQGWFEVSRADLPKVERRFRRFLKEVAVLVKPQKELKALDVDIRPAIELLKLVLAQSTAGVQKRAEQSLRLAFERPGAWIAKYGYLRGISKPTKDFHVLALLDVLIKAGAAAELDHRSEPDELKRELSKVARRLGMKPVAIEDDDIESALRRLRKQLLQEGWELVVVDIRSDSFPFLVVKASSAKRAKTLMQKIGFKLARL